MDRFPSLAMRPGMWIWSPSGRVVSQLFILLKVFKRILRPVAFSPLRGITAPQASVWPERERKYEPRDPLDAHLWVCPSGDAVLIQMLVRERSDSISMGILPLQSTSAYWALATGRRRRKSDSWGVKRCFLCCGGSCWSFSWFGGCLKVSSGEFIPHHGVTLFLTSLLKTGDYLGLYVLEQYRCHLCAKWLMTCSCPNV